MACGARYVAWHAKRTDSTDADTRNAGIGVVVDFFNHLNMLYGTVTEFCTVQEVCRLVWFTAVCVLNVI